MHRVRKYLGAYLLELEGKTDAIIFSAGTIRLWLRQLSSCKYLAVPNGSDVAPHLRPVTVQ